MSKKAKPLFEQTADHWLQPYRLEFELYGLPKIISNASRNGWRGLWAEKKKWKRAVFERVSFYAFTRDPLTSAKLTLTRHSSKEPDFDGLVSSFKAVIDGLKEAGIIADDKMSIIGQPQYRWQKAKMKQGKISVAVEEIL